MSSINDLKINQRKFKRNLRKARRILENKLPKEALAEAKRNTPRDNGNARNNTKLKKDAIGRGFSITANYDYATIIDDGLYGKPPGSANGPKTRGGFSTQAPEGIFKPTRRHLEKFLRRKFGRF